MLIAVGFFIYVFSEHYLLCSYHFNLFYSAYFSGLVILWSVTKENSRKIGKIFLQM